MAEKKTTKSKKNTKTTKKAEESSNQRQLYAILFFALGVIFTALALVGGEHLWKWLHYAIFGLFGWCAYLIGPVFIYLAVMNTMERPTFSTAAQGWESLALVLLLSGITTVFTDSMELSGGVFTKIGQLYNYGKELVGGGVLSIVFGVSGLALMGRTAAIIVELVLIAAVLMLITGTTLRGIADGTKKAGEKVKNVYNEQVEQHRAADAARRENIQIDIPIDGEPVKYQNEATGAAVRRSKEKLLGKEGRESGTARSDIDVALPWEEAGVTAVSPAQKNTVAAAEPIHGFKVASMEERPLPQDELDSIIDGFKSPSKKPPERKMPEDELDSVINGFKTAAKKQDADREAAAIKKEMENTKPTEEQMEDAKNDPQLEALINRAMQTDPANAKEKKQLNREIAAAEQQRITELMDDIEIPPYTFPTVNLLKDIPHINSADITEELRNNADLLVNTLQSFGVQARVIDISRGPAVTRYELQPGAGVKISKIAGLADDIALNLAAGGVRIEAPIPNKAAVGIEVPNRNVDVVSIKELIDSEEFRRAESPLTVALGRDISGRVAVADLAKMPHLLIAGSTGSGKSVCINSMIISLLYKSSPEDVRLLMVDPKVVELGIYNGIPHLLVPVVTDPRKAAGALNWAVSEMLKRYKSFAENGVRDIKGYNELAKTRDDLEKMPKVVIIIDELADLMMAAPGEVEDAICRLAQMARAAGMHLVIATQRPSADVITGLIKANIPSRVAFAVSSSIDSRIILDTGGAEKLLGRGDMLFSPIGCQKPSRIQGCFVSDKEVEDVVKFIKDGGTAAYDEAILDDIEKLAVQEKGKKGVSADAGEGGGFDDKDEMLPAAIECVVEMGQASTSLLQRRLKLGYARAARIIDQMEEMGVVGPFEGSKPRQVLISKEQWLERKLASDEEQ